MPESLPRYATLTTRSLLIDEGATFLSVSSESSRHSIRNLFDPLRSRRWRSTSRNEQRFVGRFDGSALPRIFALIDSNLAPGAIVKLEIASNQTFSINRSAWNLVVYEQSAARVLRWYPGTPDEGAAAASRSFFRITLPANATMDSDGDGAPDSYHELGLLYMARSGPTGSMFSVPVELGAEREVIDPSVIAVSSGGARYPAVRPPYVEWRGVEANRPDRVPSLLDDDAASIDFMRVLREVGTHRHVLFDGWAWATDPAKKADGCIYGFLGGRESVGTMTRRHRGFDTASLRIVEARA